MSEPCQCPNAGWCQRHRMDKPLHLHKLCQSREDYRALWDRKAQQPATDKPQTPKPQQTPSWVGIVSYFRTPEDTGVGDTVQRYAAMLGGEQFKVWAKKLGMPCGCTTRQKEWNLRYPYTVQHDQQQSSSH
jgi:hypothetical protein